MSPRLTALLRLGKAGAELGIRIDEVLAHGPRATARRRAETTAARALEAQGRPRVYREIWTAAATQLGASVTDLGRGFLAIQGRRRTVVWHGQVTLDDAVTLRLAADRPTAHRLLTAAGLSVVDHRLYSADDLAAASSFLAGGPVVVKPAAGTGAGLGVTCGVRTRDELARAWLRAARWDEQLLLERHLVGTELRVLVLDGGAVAAVNRRPPAVRGDGTSTIGQLITAENASRVAALGTAGCWPLRVDLDCELTLARDGRDLRSVPAPGESVTVKTAANEGGPNDTYTVDPVPPAAAELAKSAVDALGLRLAAVELIETRPGLALVEVNGTPGLHYHYQVADGSPVPVAVPILSALIS